MGGGFGSGPYAVHFLVAIPNVAPASNRGGWAIASRAASSPLVPSLLRIIKDKNGMHNYLTLFLLFGDPMRIKHETNDEPPLNPIPSDKIFLKHSSFPNLSSRI